MGSIYRQSDDSTDFLLQMSDVKRLPERLDSMLFRVRFPEEISELQPVSVVSCDPSSLWVWLIELSFVAEFVSSDHILS